MPSRQPEITLFDRLLEVQKELEVVSKTQENDYFNSKFANINDVLEMVLPILNKHGILLLQPLTHVDGKPAIKTILMHGAERMEEIMVLHEDPNPQKMGSGYTYGRRHALISAIGVRTGDDDDGALASGTQSGTQKPTAPKKDKPKAQPKAQSQQAGSTKEIPTCSICEKPMRPQKSNPDKFFCKHDEDGVTKWGKPVFENQEKVT